MKIVWFKNDIFGLKSSANFSLWLYFGQDCYISTIMLPCQLTAIKYDDYYNRNINIDWQIQHELHPVIAASKLVEITNGWDENNHRTSEASFLPSKMTKAEWLRSHPNIVDFDCGRLTTKETITKDNQMYAYEEIEYNPALIKKLNISDEGHYEINIEINRKIKAGEFLFIDITSRCSRHGSVSPFYTSNIIYDLILCYDKNTTTNTNLSFYKYALPNLPLDTTPNTAIFFPFYSAYTTAGDFASYVEGSEVNVGSAERVWTIDENNDGYPYAWGYGSVFPQKGRWYLKENNSLIPVKPYMVKDGKLVMLKTLYK